MKFDLHSHTYYSDGKLSPEDLVERAVEKGVDILAITDHDTVKALPIAQQHIDKNALPLTLVKGIEFSTKWESFEIHIVGLNIDVENSTLACLIAEQTGKRATRAEKMAEKLEKRGFENVLEQAKALANKGQLTRAHFAQVIQTQGAAKTLQGVFKKFLVRGKPGYVTSEWCDIATAVKAIKAAGGQAVLAHPSRYKLSNKWLRRLLEEFKHAGGDGIEVALPQQAPSDRQFLAQLADEYQLLSSQGSDFHFATNWLELGKNLYLPKASVPIWQDWAIAKEQELN
ncbi:Error-prone DNA polymerase [Pseudoalteromonas sp. P1-9]|uniref:RNase RNM n=1 Tax=Pseudoalteromonas sp. P1-9 TaxID=1710354 RepID=UPI0006D610A9|nr:PHP domain-containing protein [Pseudoalteromonas sp. P1-9]KPV96071.1 Error-prone DNA polymerase [Pseudoalteromonas sp. P1-9]